MSQLQTPPEPSPSATVVSPTPTAASPSSSHAKLPKIVTSDAAPEARPAEKAIDPIHAAEHDHPLAKLSQNKKHFLLFVFSIAVFLDISNLSGVGVAVAQISADIGLAASQIVWIITSYSLCFAAFLLFGGRLSDLFPAQLIFEGGFIGLGIISLITSFVTTNKYGFLILRGLGGVFGALTIPSSYHLLVHMFPDPAEQAAKLALLGMAGAVGNVLGVVLAGLTMLASYHWFFRLVAILALTFSACAVLLLPWTPAPPVPAGVSKWKLLDIPGVVLMMGFLICFILGLTQGPIDGWGSAAFIAPFVLSFFLIVGFFVWEAYIPPRVAVLPSTIWKIINMLPSSLAVMIAMAFWTSSQLQYATWFQVAFGWSPIHVAATLLPQGIVAMLVGVTSQFFPSVITKPRIFIPIGGVLIIAAELLQIYSDGGAGMDYWRYVFPAFLLGSTGAALTYFGSAINIVIYAPPEMSGVIAAWTQVVAQIGSAVVLAVQAGFEGAGAEGGGAHTQIVSGGLASIVPQSVLAEQWHNTAAKTYWFQIAWTAVLAIQYFVLWRRPGKPEDEHEATRKRIAESGKETGVPPVAVAV